MHSTHGHEVEFAWISDGGLMSRDAAAGHGPTLTFNAAEVGSSSPR
jgi:hypothetical protein